MRRCATALVAIATVAIGVAGVVGRASAAAVPVVNPAADANPVGGPTAATTAGTEANATQPVGTNELTIEAGYAGAYEPTVPMPVRVTITAERLVRTDLVVQGDGPPIRTPVEVAGGSRKQIVVLLPTPDAGGPVTVKASLGAGPPVTTDVDGRGTSELVGVTAAIHGAKALPATATLAVDAGQARFADLGPDEFALGADGLAALAAIALVILLALIPAPIYISVPLGLSFLLVPAYYHLRRNMVRYTLTDSKIELDTGLIARTTRNIPLSKIQDVTVSASIPQRMLGFGDVIIDNASELGGTTLLHNISNPRHYADLLLRELRRWH